MNSTSRQLVQDIERLINEPVITCQAIRRGHSQQGFHCQTRDNHYFVKVFNNTKALHTELSFLLSGIDNVPCLIAHDSKLFVQAFIDAPLLFDVEQDKIKRLVLLTRGLTTFHQDAQQHVDESQFTPLRMSDALTSLHVPDLLTKQQSISYHTVLEQALFIDSLDMHSIVCHGDFNANNVFYSDGRFVFIDFEAASLAPAAYDLMMMLSINGYLSSDIEETIRLYNQFMVSAGFSKIDLCAKQLESLFNIATVINGLWYLKKAKDENRFDEYATRHFNQLR